MSDLLELTMTILYGLGLLFFIPFLILYEHFRPTKKMTDAEFMHELREKPLTEIEYLQVKGGGLPYYYKEGRIPDIPQVKYIPHFQRDKQVNILFGILQRAPGVLSDM